MKKWTIDPDHSVAAFSTRHMMITEVRGQFNGITGTIYFDPANRAYFSVEAEVDVWHFTTGTSKRDDHLRSSDSFYA